MLTRQTNSLFVLHKVAIFLKSIFLAVCIGFFISQAYIVYDLYLKNATVSGITYDEPDQYIFPSVTVCPIDVLKKKSFPISEQEFDEVSFKKVSHN